MLSDILSLRVKSEQSYTINDIKQDGTLDLYLEKKDGQVSKYPIIFYEKVKSEISPFGAEYEGLLIPINRY